MAENVQPGDWVAGPLWEAAVQVVGLETRDGYDVVAVAGRNQEPTRTHVVTPTDWEQITRATRADRRHIRFSGDASRFRLGIQAHRLRLAHSIDPHAALNASRIDALPHQFETVYGHLLARPVVRALLAHDAGAGKTVIAGLVIKELKRCQGVHWVLIVAPAGLTVQWRRELLTKFGEDLAIVDRDYMRQEGLDGLDVWRETDFAVTSMGFARQKRTRRALESVEWDLVIVDEAHKMAAYRRPNGSIRKTQAYELGEILSRHTTHLLLLTATPHKGSPENYRLLISLVNPQWGEATAHVSGADLMVLRRTKEEMRKDLGDKVLNVVGEVLWGDDLRRTLERVALGDREAVDEARRLVDQAEDAVREALAAETRAAATTEPLDMADFRRKQATFAAHRLSPEEAEKFFRQAVPFAGGTLEEFTVQPSGFSETSEGSERLAFEVVLPPDLQKRRRRKVRVSFWPEVCSDDGSRDEAVLFIAPGHWLFDVLLDRVIADCGPDLEQGAVFLDLQPEGESPYLVWFVRSGIHDGLGRRAGDLLATVQHRADQERVVALPSEILDAFELGAGQDLEAGIRQGQAMLGAQDEIIDGCVCKHFLPDLTEHQKRQQTTLVRDRRFLEEGLNALAEHLSAASIDAYLNDDEAEAERLVDQSNAVQQRKDALLADLDRAGHLVLTAPDVLGVTLVLPAPLEVVLESEDGQAKVIMRRDDKMEGAAMQAVVEYQIEQGRTPRDVHHGKSWDIESYDDQGNLLRYIEVKGRGSAGADVVMMTDPEWEAARRLGERHWLYIVRLGDGMLVMMQNPRAKLDPRELKRWLLRIRDAEAQGEIVALDKQPDDR